MTALSVGTAFITATANDGSGATAGCIVTVTATITTIVWDDSNIEDLLATKQVPYEKEGITLFVNDGSDDNLAIWYNNNYPAGILFVMKEAGGYRFKAPDGKNFIRIEMTISGTDGWIEAIDGGKLGGGWPSGNAADVFPEGRKSCDCG